MLVLDSQLVQYVEDVLLKHSEDKRRRSIVRDLVVQNRNWRSEFQPLAYLREIVIHMPLAAAESFAKVAIEATLRIATIDVARLEASDEFVQDEEKAQGLCRAYGVSSFADAAQAIVGEMFAQDVPALEGDFLAIYGTVLKAIQIGLTEKGKPTEKKAELVEDYISSQLGFVQPRFFAIARLFLNGDLSGLLKTNPGDPKFPHKHLIGGAYDLYLTTIHEKILAESVPPDAYLAIFCTADKALGNFAGRFPLRAVSALERGDFRIYHEWDDDWLRDLLGTKLFESLQQNIEYHLSKGPSVKGPAKVIEAIKSLEGTLGIQPGDSVFKSFGAK